MEQSPEVGVKVAQIIITQLLQQMAFGNTFPFPHTSVDDPASNIDDNFCCCFCGTAV